LVFSAKAKFFNGEKSASSKTGLDADALNLETGLNSTSISKKAGLCGKISLKGTINRNG
jgi:hypothetical protein